jgi:hypothetical protein
MGKTATDNNLGIADLVLQAGESFASKQFYLVSMDTDEGDVVVAASNGKILGVIQNTPASGEAAQVRTARGTTSKVVAGEEISAGDLIQSSSGKGITATGAAQKICGIAVTGASADGEVFEMLLCDGYVA